MSDGDMAYVSRKPCGCVVAATVDRPRFRRDIAKFVAREILVARSVSWGSTEASVPSS